MSRMNQSSMQGSYHRRGPSPNVGYKRTDRQMSRSRSFSRERTGGNPYYSRRSPVPLRGRPFSRAVPERDNPTPSRCLGVFGLSLKTRERDLYDVFSRFGEIEEINMIFDNYTGRSRGFGFVYFHEVEDARAAKDEIHGMEIDGRPARVDFSITNRPHPPTPGIYMGKSSFDDGRRGGQYHRGRDYPRGGGHSRRSPPSRRYSRSRSPSFDRYDRRY